MTTLPNSNTEPDDMSVGPMVAIHSFAKALTTKVRELDEMEREGKLYPQQATEILKQMIEAHIYAIFNTMYYSNRYDHKDRAAAEAAIKTMLANDGLFGLGAQHLTTIEKEGSDE